MKTIFSKGREYARRTKSTNKEVNHSVRSTFPLLSIALFAICICAAVFAPVAGAVKLGMLYMYADNGKKSGRADGNVYMRNGRIRAMRVPSLVRNAYTMGVRSFFASLSAGFRSLTQSQINAWNGFSYSNSDVFGRSKEVKGKQAFVGLNQNLNNIGAATIDNPPVSVATGAQDVDTVDISVGDAEITLGGIGAPIGGCTNLLFATSPVSAGVSRPSKSAFRIFYNTTNLSTPTASQLYTAYVTKFGEPAEGKKIFFAIQGINNTTGQSAPGRVISNVVVA